MLKRTEVQPQNTRVGGRGEEEEGRKGGRENMMSSNTAAECMGRMQPLHVTSTFRSEA
jgi:hypothetical protein